jgi:hypothetical protein
MIWAETSAGNAQSTVNQTSGDECGRTMAQSAAMGENGKVLAVLAVPRAETPDIAGIGTPNTRSSILREDLE